MNDSKRIAPFGAWPSPLQTEALGAYGSGFSELKADGDALYWLEQRPAERGRAALCRWSAASGLEDACPAESDVGTRVDEYGGGGYDVAHGTLVASERSDGSVWIARDGERRTLAAVAGCRFADFALARDGRVAFAVREDHRDRPPTDPQTTIVRLDLETAAPADVYTGEIVVSGADFYAQPRLSPDGASLAWIEWDHPAMPWDASRLCVAELDASGTIGAPSIIAAGEREAISHLAWGSDGTLSFTSDRTGWWNLYAARDGAVRAVTHESAREIGAPIWTFGTSPIGVRPSGALACAYVERGTWHAALVNDDGTLRDLPIPGAGGALAPIAFGSRLAAIVAGANAPAAVVTLEANASAPDVTTIVAKSIPGLRADDIAEPRAFEIPTPDGDHTHAYYFAPTSAEYRGPDGERPPLVMMAHGGPTALYTARLDPRVQWWTTRGFAVAHVNYRGSSGFGTAYRRKLNERWCEIDVIDAIATARFLIDRELADPKRIAIRGGSASGTWALLAISESPLFACATSEFGVTDLEMLARETHKFEARYMDSMIGPLPATRERYRERSPIERAPTIKVPVLLLQGLDDKVVPPNQAEHMRDALRAAGTDVEYHAYDGEGHGFRKAENIADAFEREARFYRRVFGIT